MPIRTPRPRAPRWHRRPDARPEEILEAALQVFDARGYARTRLEDVAHKAGVSKGTLYLYFDSKDALFREVIRATKGQALTGAEALMEQFDGTTREALTLLMRRMWSHMNDPRQASVSRLVQSEIKGFPELARFYAEEVVFRARRLLESVLARGVTRGEIRVEQARFAARAIPALAIQLSAPTCFHQAYDPDPLSNEALVEGAIDLVLNGVSLVPSRGAR
ncbi:MAG: TetR/AcrR family transcriptional regulator [Gemmatimonadales bacterium]